MVEKTKVKRIFSKPLHPYSKGLLNSLPHPLHHHLVDVLFTPGVDKALLKCKTERPKIVELETGHLVHIIYIGKLKGAEDEDRSYS